MFWFICRTRPKPNPTMQLLALAALIVGTLLYRSEMGWPTIGKYWAVFWGALLLVLILPPIAVVVVQCFTAAIFFTHVKLKAANLG
jgi:hypothetical protein